MATRPENTRDISTMTTSERTPLLAVSEATSITQNNEDIVNGLANGHAGSSHHPKTSNLNEPPSHSDEGEERPLPKLQIFLLCYCALVEPVSYFCIFPFVNQMIKENSDVKEEDVGFWSGTIESLFSLVQMFLMIFYGRMADRIGRKPVLVFSLAGIAISTSFFGMSKTLWQMIVLRCAAGLFAGSSVTIRTMTTENSTPKTQARAFSFYAFTRNLGIFLGPLCGGAFSKPAKQYPGLFGGNHFLIEYPYALPTILTGMISGTAALLSLFFLQETLKSSQDVSGIPTKAMTIWEIFKAPGVAPVLGIFTNVMLLGLAFTAVCPVFFFTQPALGGLGFTIQQISIFLAVGGGSQALWILLAFPPLQRRFSTGWVIRACAYTWPIFFISFPLCNEFLRLGWMVPFCIVVIVNCVGGSGVSMAFTCVQLALNDIAPSPATLGTLNAIALTLNSGLRAVAPAMFSSIFATGVRLRWMDGHLVWFVLTACALVLCTVVQWLPPKAEGMIRRPEDIEE